MSVSIITKGIICDSNNTGCDWTPSEKQQIRDALGIDGLKTNAVGGQLQNILSNQNRILGLVHENIYIDNPTFDSDGNMISARLRIYSNPVDVGTSNGVIGTYNISAPGNGPGRFTSWSQIRVS
jgi:hypothetical protein